MADTKPTIVLVHGAWADASSWAGSSSGCSARASRAPRRRTTCAARPRTPPMSAPISRRCQVPSSWSVTPMAAS